jgi:histidyl-tRNA synthetase
MRVFRLRAGLRSASTLERVRGMRDETCADVKERKELCETALREMRLFGFRQMNTPVLEKRELFVRGLGAGK